MRHLRLLHAAALVLIAAFASQSFGQVWPLPDPPPKVTVCSACPVPEKDHPTWPYNDPIQAFTGRYLDSLYVRDYQQTFRTGRASGVLVMPSLNRVYLQIGHAVAAYSMSSFFSRLENRETPVKATSYPGNYRIGWQNETWLGWDTHFYAENPDTGWTTPVIDGQDRLVRFDVDDRGYVYMAYTIFGWGIAKDAGQTDGGLMKSVYQDYPHPQFAPNQIVVLRNSANRYYCFVGGPNAISMELFDVTDPANPQKLREYPQGFIELAKGTSTLAAVDVNNKLWIYDIDTMTAGGGSLTSAVAPGGGVFQAVATDGTNYYAAYKTTSAKLGITAFVRQANGTYARTDYPQGTGDFDGRSIKYGDGYLSVTGWHGGGDLRLFKLNGNAPEEVPTQDFFFKYYAGPPTGYARPPIAAPAGAVTVRYGGKLYLILPAFGLGDVWQLKADGFVTVLPQGAVGLVNPNADARVATEVFYGDNVGFSASSTAQKSLTWNFGNPEATGDPNTTTSGVGTIVRHQYSGLTPQTLGGARTVTTTDQNNVASGATVTLKAPRARVGVSGSNLRITAPDSNSGVPIVYGDTFFDASDGDIEGHYASWNIDGAVTKTQPYTVTGQHLVPVGSCGAHTLGFDAFYGPYSFSTFTTIGPNYQVGLHGTGYDFNYKVLPFAAAINTPTSDATNVTFSSASRATTNTSILPAGPQVLGWQWDLVDAQDKVFYAGIAGYAANPAGIPSWSVPKSAFTARNLRARLLLQSTQPLGAACASYSIHRAFTAALNGPDPAINGGCTNGGPPCSFTAASVSGVNPTTDGWSYSWSVQPSGNVSAPVTNAATFQPTFTQAGLYTVSLTATNAIGTQTVTKNVNVTKASPQCLQMGPNTLFIHYTGPSTGCSEYSGTCSPGESLPFTIKTFSGYDLGCAPHTFQWNFGDGTTASTINATHRFNVAGTYDVTCTINNGGTPYTATQRVVVGAGTPPQPTCLTMDDSNIYIGYAGLSSSCTQTGGTCAATETIGFSVQSSVYNFGCYPNHTFTWNFGDQTASGSGKGLAHTFAKPGTYPVSVTIFNGVQTFTATASVTVGPAINPVCPPMNANNVFISFHNAANSCNEGSNRCGKGESLELTAKTFGYSFACSPHAFHWDFGDGATSDGIDATHTYATSGTYAVKLTISNPQQTFIAQQPIIIRSDGDIPGRIVPDVSFNVTAADLASRIFSFTPIVVPSSTILKWSWDFGDGQKVSATSGSEQVHQYSVFGAYQVTLTVEDKDGPVKTYTREVLVQPSHRRAKR